nr:DUF2306 domain-containing protein [Amycolatopsis vancoresmycina]
MWPWLRRTHPVAHRRIGRVYVFAGAIDVVAALLWLGFTIAGWRAIRRRRYGDHRKWMVRSFAMCMNTLMTRALSPVGFLLVLPRGGDKTTMILTAAAVSGVLSVLSLLLLSQWWLERKPASAQ